VDDKETGVYESGGDLVGVASGDGARDHGGDDRFSVGAGGVDEPGEEFADGIGKGTIFGVSNPVSMPFVQISHSIGLNEPAKKAISLSIHSALVEVFGIPGEDYFHTIAALPPDGLLYAPAYLGVEHWNPFVAIQIFCKEGRTVEMKQRLYREIAERIAASTAVAASNVFIVIVENPAANWSFGDGKAQMVTGEFEQYTGGGAAAGSGLVDSGGTGAAANGLGAAANGSGAKSSVGSLRAVEASGVPDAGSGTPGLQRRRLMTADLGKRQVTSVHVQEIRFAPGMKAGLHFHPCPVTGYILKGTAVLEIDGEAPQVLPAGSAFYEPAGERIRRFDNHSSTEEMIFTAFYLLDGEQNLIEMIKE
jgi:quercetin dioxygenase-like cupin family protein/phenylpyruvate tautomerase PptA (4-oxalocrotonate tautomerase family)